MRAGYLRKLQLAGLIVAAVLSGKAGAQDNTPGIWYCGNWGPFSCSTSDAGSCVSQALSHQHHVTSCASHGGGPVLTQAWQNTGTFQTWYTSDFRTACGQTNIDPRVHQCRTPISGACPGGAPPGADGNCPASCDFANANSFLAEGSGSAPTQVCDSSTSCKANRGGVTVEVGGRYAARYFPVDESCSGSEVTGEATENNCIATGSMTYCADADAQQNCGTVNGEYVCLDSVPPGGCIFTSSGQAICDGGSMSQTPDGSIGTPDGGVDVFGGGLDGTDGTVAGTGDGGPEQGEEGGECQDESCSGTLPGEFEAVDSFAQLFSAFYARVESAPIIAAISSIPGSLPAGSCSGVDSDAIAFLNGQVLTIDIHCQLWPNVSAVIYPVMLALWGVLGAIIILRA